VQGPLPSGWEERVTGTGRPYFVCHETRVSQVKDTAPITRSLCCDGNVSPEILG
ncbi:unnamed protein product, partial [Hapterophycus canaliculatus]